MPPKEKTPSPAPTRTVYPPSGTPAFYGVRERDTVRATRLFSGPFETAADASASMMTDAKPGDRMLVILGDVVEDRTLKVTLE